MPTRSVLTTLLLALLATLAPTASAAPTDDFDQDNIPDAVESELCGRAGVRALFQDPVPYDCVTTTDLRYDSSLYDEVHGQAEFVLGIVDADGDYLADAAETVICQFENQNDPSDGTCTGDDYDASTIGCDPTGLEVVCIDDNPYVIGQALGLPFGVHVKFGGTAILNI